MIAKLVVHGLAAPKRCVLFRVKLEEYQIVGPRTSRSSARGKSSRVHRGQSGSWFYSRMFFLQPSLWTFLQMK